MTSKPKKVHGANHKVLAGLIGAGVMVTAALISGPQELPKNNPTPPPPPVKVTQPTYPSPPPPPPDQPPAGEAPDVHKPRTKDHINCRGILKPRCNWNW